jgi:hypothetical protein
MPWPTHILARTNFMAAGSLIACFHPIFALARTCVAMVNCTACTWRTAAAVVDSCRRQKLFSYNDPDPCCSHTLVCFCTLTQMLYNFRLQRPIKRGAASVQPLWPRPVRLTRVRLQGSQQANSPHWLRSAQRRIVGQYSNSATCRSQPPNQAVRV